MKKLYGEASIADTSQLWYTIDPSHISSIDSDEGFQQGDPASTALLYWHPVLYQTTAAIPLSPGSCPHPFLRWWRRFITLLTNQYGSCIDYQIQSRPLNAINKTTLISASIQQCFICISPILLNPPPTLITSFSDYHQHLRHCFFTKPSHLFHTIPSRFTLSFAYRVSAIGHRVFNSMTSHSHTTLSALQCHQHLLLVRESAFPASIAQCIHDVTDILTLLQPLHDPSQFKLPTVSFLHTPNPISLLNLTQSRSSPHMTQQSLLITQRIDSKVCYHHSLTTLSTTCSNSMTPHSLSTTIPPLMMTLAYGPALMPVLVIIPWQMGYSEHLFSNTAYLIYLMLFLLILCPSGSCNILFI